METERNGISEEAKPNGVRTLLVRSIEIVTFLFAAFGHFLTEIAPPEEGGTQFAIGISSLLALCALLYISAISKRLPPKKFATRWLISAGVFLAMALATALIYQANFLKYTFHFPHEHSTEIYIGGTTYTAEAMRYRQGHPQKSVQDILLDFGGLEARTHLWTEVSMREATMWLTTNYIAFVLSVAATIFSLTEGVLVNRRAK
jgi:hypothetical protein